MTKIILTCFLSACGWCLSAQSISPSVLANSGNDGETTTNQIEWTLGEMSIMTLSDGSNSVTQGFHQPLLFTVGTFDGRPDITMNIFPNPTEDRVKLVYEENVSLEYILYDAKGAVKQSSSLHPGTNEINLDNMSAGHYILSVISNNEMIKTFTIEKTGI